MRRPRDDLQMIREGSDGDERKVLLKPERRLRQEEGPMKAALGRRTILLAEADMLVGSLIDREDTITPSSAATAITG
jgi:hypothetical protein